MGVYVRVSCEMRQCEHNENGWCDAEHILLRQSGDYDMKCQNNTTKYWGIEGHENIIKDKNDIV